MRRSEKRPNYLELYAKQFDRRHKNEDNYQKVLVKFEKRKKKGHGPLNILKDQKEGADNDTGSHTGSSFAESGKIQDGGPSGQVARDQPARRRKLAVTQVIGSDLQRHKTIGTLDSSEVDLEKHRLPQLSKYTTLDVSPKTL